MVIILTILLVSMSLSAQTQNTVTLKNAKVTFSNNKITASTGLATRSWKLTSSGLATTSLQSANEEELITLTPNTDWEFPWMSEDNKAKLIKISSEIDNDQGFINNFIKTTIEFNYTIAKIGLIYEIWTLPNAPGFRTQLHLKKLDGYKKIDDISNGVVENLQLKKTINKAVAFGYYNDTQQRNKRNTPILKTEEFNIGGYQTIDWASGIKLHNQNTGLIVIKESHKCVNQNGVNTGAIYIDNNQISITGAAINQTYLKKEYQPCWATWTIPYDGQQIDSELALKQFDRKRYPIDPERDIYIMSNTWGSNNGSFNSKYCSREENILKELKVSEELGLDILQIDDGWQGTNYKTWHTATHAYYFNFKPHQSDQLMPNGTKYDLYPEGWINVRKAAHKAGIKLGLWASWLIPYNQLVSNYELGGFSSFKLDFTNLTDYRTLRGFENKVRDFILQTNHKIRVNWDVTEDLPRVGYYYGREYGNIYLENRKPEKPVSTIYRPWLVLRDAWHIAKYLNLNKFQVTYQNLDRVDPKASDAHLHNHDYALAITLMASPIFFQEIHLLTPNAKTSIKPLIAKYKSIRNEMYQGYVFSIGQEPSNASFTGFQNFNPQKQNGFLTLFKEINCQRNSFKYELNFLKGKNVQFTNLISGKTFTINNFKSLKCSIKNAGDYQLLAYKIINK